MHPYPTHSASFHNQSAVASTGNRWTAILQMLSFQFRQRVIAATWRRSILAFPNIQCKERVSSHGVKAGVSTRNI
jgi:hypothetical protein